MTWIPTVRPEFEDERRGDPLKRAGLWIRSVHARLWVPGMQILHEATQGFLPHTSHTGAKKWVVWDSPCFTMHLPAGAPRAKVPRRSPALQPDLRGDHPWRQSPRASASDTWTRVGQRAFKGSFNRLFKAGTLKPRVGFGIQTRIGCTLAASYSSSQRPACNGQPRPPLSGVILR